MQNILFNVPMTKAILDGRKVQTRRVIKADEKFYYKTDEETRSIHHVKRYVERYIKENAKYQIGENIWAREPARVIGRLMNGMIRAEYKADGELFYIDAYKKWSITPEIPKWAMEQQSIPNGCIKEMARIFLKITNVRVERLQDISHGDVYDEGYGDGTDLLGKQWWIKLWNKTAPKGYKWEDNPYVFVYEFEKIEINNIKTSTVDENTKIDYISRPFKTLREQQPSKDGYYYVIWEDGDKPKKVYLRDCRDICSDDREPLWVWGIDEEDDPESVILDIDDAWQIQWCSVDEFERVEK